MRRGFTIVELVITITVMGILLTLAVVNLIGTQVNARDTERKTDIESIQLHLEDYAKNGTDGATNVGTYPNVDLAGGSIESIRLILRDIDDKSVTAPGVTDPALTLKPANNDIQTTAGIDPEPAVSEYVYQPIDSNGDLCTSTDCRKYNLYYRLEADNTIYMVTSKNQ